MTTAIRMGAVCSAPSGIAASNCQSSNLHDGTLSAADELAIPPIRTLGFRPQNPWDTPPICSIRHSGRVRRGVSVRVQTPVDLVDKDSPRVHVAACKFDTGQRIRCRSEDLHLMETMEAFLVELIAAWSPRVGLGPFDPQFSPVDHDDQAFIDALRDIDPNPTMIASQVAMTPASVDRGSGGAIELDDRLRSRAFARIESPPGGTRRGLLNVRHYQHPAHARRR